MLGDVFAVFLSLTDTLCQQIFNLPVDGSKIILCPGSDLLVQLI